MKRFSFMALAIAALAVSCTSDNLVPATEEPTAPESTVRMGESVGADLGESTISISSTNGTSSAKKRAASAETPVTAYFYVRVDSRIPSTEEEEVVMSVSTKDYYPQTEYGGSDKDFAPMQKPIYVSMLGDNHYLLDTYGRQTVEVFAEGEPSYEDVVASFKGKKVTYHGEVIYDPANGIDLTDNYKVIWYVAKVEDSDGCYHVDGALVPKDAEKAPVTKWEQDKLGTEDDKSEESKEEIEKEKEASEADIVVPLDVDYDLVLEVDDFDIRKSGVADYVAYEKVVDGNTLEYNGVTITRGSDMKVKISGLDKLDWSEEGTVWTFEAYLWAKFDLVPSDWAYGDEDKSYTLESGCYDIEVHEYKGFQSEGTVPYIKVSVHVTKKAEATTETE